MSNATRETTTKTFADFGVDPGICESLAEVGIINPFPIQELTLPLALTGADIIGQARTGTGKTLGFGLPMLQRVDLDGRLQVLIIVPTRELCMQVAEDLTQAGKGRGVKVVAVYGGKAMQPQIDALADGAHVVVGTPGRLLDLSRRGFMDLSSCSGLVLDEADEMLDLGFLPDVEALVEQCADERQTLLFSATMPGAIVGLARRYMRKPTFMRADVEEVHIAPKTQQHFFSCHRMDKPAVVARILQTPNRGLCVIFCRTKRMADQLAEELRDRDVAAQAIHSDLRQEARERALKKFREGTTTVLCATEVAARGLDIDDVTHVINYDCPDDEKMYLHRIGRTGRAGADGVAITFAVWNELPRLEMIRRELDIEDEIHEVFSTSPLLDELFDLPPREEKKKVPSPPKARTGKASRSKRRSESSDRRKGRDKSDRDGADRDRGDRKPARAKTTRDTSDTTDKGNEPTRTRTRTRTRRADGERGTTPATESTDRATRPRRDADVEDVKASRGDDTRGEGRSRTRRRTSGEGDQSGTSKSSSRAKGGRDRDDQATSKSSRGGDRERSRTRSDGKGRDRDGKTRDRDGKTRDRDGKTRDGDKTRSGGNTRGGSKGGKNRNGGGKNRNGGRGGSGSSRGGERQRTRKTEVDSEAARGDGQPRLKRRMEVVHLP